MGTALITRRGGGAALNFKVVGGTTEPLNPAENTIWVNTDTEITAWAFSADDPSGVVELTCTKAVEDAYLDASGTQKYHSNFTMTNYVELPAGATTITTNNDTDTSDFYHAFYNASKTLISTVQRKAGEISYDVPASAAYVRLSLYDSDPLTVTAAIAPAEGTAWISAGMSATDANSFNALKKNVMYVSPVTARQYVDGAWRDRTAQIYARGAWSFLGSFYYNRGVQVVPWEVKWNNSGEAIFGVASVSLRATDGGYDKGITIGTTNPVDLTNISSIIFEATTLKVTASSSFSTNFLVADVLTNGRPNMISALARATVEEAVVEGIFALDVSNITGQHYVGVGVDNGMSQCTEPVYLYSCEGK